MIRFIKVKLQYLQQHGTFEYVKWLAGAIRILF